VPSARRPAEALSRPGLRSCSVGFRGGRAESHGEEGDLEEEDDDLEEEDHPQEDLAQEDLAQEDLAQEDLAAKIALTLRTTSTPPFAQAPGSSASTLTPSPWSS